MITVPALYKKYGDYVDKCCGVIHHQFSKHYRIVDENVVDRLPHNTSKDKESWFSNYLSYAPCVKNYLFNLVDMLFRTLLALDIILVEDNFDSTLW
jgi:hypothetical protein